MFGTAEHGRKHHKHGSIFELDGIAEEGKGKEELVSPRPDMGMGAGMGAGTGITGAAGASPDNIYKLDAREVWDEPNSGTAGNTQEDGNQALSDLTHLQRAQRQQSLLQSYDQDAHNVLAALQYSTLCGLRPPACVISLHHPRVLYSLRLSLALLQQIYYHYLCIARPNTPAYMHTLITLGEVYKAQGALTRARACYQEYGQRARQQDDVAGVAHSWMLLASVHQQQYRLARLARRGVIEIKDGDDGGGGVTSLPAPLSPTQMATLAYPVFTSTGDADTSTATLTSALVQQLSSPRQHTEYAQHNAMYALNTSPTRQLEGAIDAYEHAQVTTNTHQGAGTGERRAHVMCWFACACCV